MTLHVVSYDTLHKAYAELQKWMQAEGRTPAGPPWERVPDGSRGASQPRRRRTEVYRPL